MKSSLDTQADFEYQFNPCTNFQCGDAGPSSVDFTEINTTISVFFNEGLFHHLKAMRKIADLYIIRTTWRCRYSQIINAG